MRSIRVLLTLLYSGVLFLVAALLVAGLYVCLSLSLRDEPVSQTVVVEDVPVNDGGQLEERTLVDALWGVGDDGYDCVVYGVVERTSVAAGAALAIVAAQLGGGLGSPVVRPGVHGLGALVDAKPFLAELAQRGVRAAVFEGVPVG